LEELAGELELAHSVTVTPMSFDLASATAGADLRAATAAAGIRVTGIVNNVGFGTSATSSPRILIAWHRRSPSTSALRCRSARRSCPISSLRERGS
jgi:hypothetical protein